MSITRLVATYRLTTPMFCAGADQERAEIRPASFKGALRFWYRAIALAKYGDVNAVREAEAELFGSTAAQAKVRLSIREIKEEPRLKSKSPLGIGRAYLAGLGLSNPVGGKNLTKREALGAGSRFSVHFLLNDDMHLELLRDAIICLGLFGGIGSRSRRGFGSVTLEALVQDGNDLFAAPRNIDELAAAIKSLKSRHTCNMRTPPYSAFSTETRIVLLPSPDDDITVEMLHEKLGFAFLHFRSYGQNINGERVVAGHSSLKIFKDDHDEMYDVAIGDVNEEENVLAPRRSAFGLPHNYFFKEDRLTVQVNGKNEKRRASPLLFHIHEAAGQSPVAVACFLPAKFLSEPVLRVSSKASGKLDAELPRPGTFWQPIHEFLNEINKGGKSQLSAKFLGAVEVKP